MWTQMRTRPMWSMRATSRLLPRSLSTNTNRLKGLALEEQTVDVMRSMKCELTPTQISQDGGIDHHGVWDLPDMQVEVVTQCKNESSAVGVQSLREFHGSLSRYSTHTVGLFVSASGYSIYARRFFQRMDQPCILSTIENGQFTSFFLNTAAHSLLPKLTCATMFNDYAHELVLTYGGEILG